MDTSETYLGLRLPPTASSIKVGLAPIFIELVTCGSNRRRRSDNFREQAQRATRKLQLCEQRSRVAK